MENKVEAKLVFVEFSFTKFSSGFFFHILWGKNPEKKKKGFPFFFPLSLFISGFLS